MKKKQYIKPIVLFEDMDISDCILGVSQPGKAVIVNATSDYQNSGKYNPTVANEGVSNPDDVASKESDWSYDYSFDLDW